ncbi:LysM domain-containing protein [Sinomicrobium oceani]|uniref:LysM domain-containing protein n=1 Tax=Sinomicrobium oceani TaxID=1150368 RepID=A0A1K1RE70_9FLAO|nr:LysM peptidoglycan-binding domain-containing protein [Sinomicrobium oceani]SFW70352.1 LysM domain-containing protein [Sinomicrobium oceani]
MGTSVSFGDYSPGVLPVTIVVRTAYFAKKKTEDILEETTEEYTVVAGDNLSKIAGNYEGVSYQDIMEENGLTSTVISVGDTLTITSRKKTGEKTSFEKIKNGNVGDEVYIVAEHFGIVSSIQVTLKEKEALLTDGGMLPVLQDESEITTIELCEPEEENLKGTHRYAKVKLRPKEDETLEEWREKLGEKEVMGYTDGQRSISPESYDRMITKEGWEPEYGEAIKSLLSIEVEAQAEGEITYRGTDKSNVFLNEEGEWFEVKSEEDGYVILADGTIEIGNVLDEKIRYYIENKSGNIEFVGEFIKNDNELIQLPSSFNFESEDANSSFAFSVKSGNEYRSYISPISLAAIIGAMSEANIEDVTIVGFSVEDGSSPAPSTSHKNGRNGDFRYLRKDKSGGALYIDSSAEDLDEDRQNDFNDALYKYGYTDLLSFKYNIDSEERLLNHSRHYANHHHHLHIQGFNPTTKNIGE